MSAFCFVAALSRRGQNARPQAAGEVVRRRHVGAEPVQRGGKSPAARRSPVTVYENWTE